MGVDVYLKVDGEESDLAYYREGYGYSVSATAVLFSEDWEKQPYNEKNAELSDMRGCGFVIKNSVLRERLPCALKAIEKRYEDDDDDDKEYIAERKKGLKEFVKTHGELEKEGKKPRIVISY